MKVGQIFKVSILILAKRISATWNLDFNMSILDLCEKIGVSRQYAYEIADRILKYLEAMSSSEPGRPRRTSGNSASNSAVGSTTGSDDSRTGEDLKGLNGKSAASDALTIKVLRYRLDNPGSMVAHKRRATYASDFKRYILDRYDEIVPLKLNQDEFASATEISIDTLRNWLSVDREEFRARKSDDDTVPCLEASEASELTLELVDLRRKWCGSTRDFIPHAAKFLEVNPAQVTRVLRILAYIASRRKKQPRYRGSTEKVQPGSILVEDGKEVSVYLKGTDVLTKRTIHAIVDQTTGTVTGSSVRKEECAEGAREAFEKSVVMLGGEPPGAVLIDNKPCYDSEEFRKTIEPIAEIIKATPGRGQNKAIIEGTFSELERSIGTIVLDDSSKAALVSSAVSEVSRVFFDCANRAARVEQGGKSRLQLLREARPSIQQKERDAAFIRKLKARHEKKYPSFKDEVSRVLLDDIFERRTLLDRDPNGSLRRYLSYCQPEAIRRAAAVFATKVERNLLDHKFEHRYLAKLVLSFQEELDLEIAEDELLKLAKVERAWWPKREEDTHAEIVRQHPDPTARCSKIAEMAAHAGIPVQAAFWREKLREEVKENIHVAPGVRRHIRRYFEAAINVRIALLDMLAQIENGLAA